MTDYQTHRGIITSPGKFEGEPRYAPYFWGIVTDGLAQRDESADIDVVIVGDKDREIFPELRHVLHVALEEDELGFVYVTEARPTS